MFTNEESIRKWATLNSRQKEIILKLDKLGAISVPKKTLASMLGISRRTLNNYLTPGGDKYIVEQMGFTNQFHFWDWYSNNKKYFLSQEELNILESELFPEGYERTYEYYVKNASIDENIRKFVFESVMKINQNISIFKLSVKILLQFYKEKNMLKYGSLTYPVVFYRNNFNDKSIEFLEKKMIFIDIGNKISYEKNFEYRHHASTVTRSLNFPSKVTFALSEIKEDLSIEYYASDYFSGIDTSEVLKWELSKTIDEASRKNLENESQIINFVLENLPYRRKIEQETSGNLLSGQGRIATLGVSMLFVYKDKDEKYYYTIGMRSAQGVAVQPGFYHIAPAGMFQTEANLTMLVDKGELVEETSPKKRILCEFLEEIYGLEEYKEPKKTLAEMQENIYIQEVEKLIEKGEANFLFSGIAFDLINLRPELCFVLLVRNYSQILVENIAGNDEYVNKRVLKKPITHLEQTGDLPEYLKPEVVVAAGAAAIFEGYKLIKELKLI